MAKCDYNDPLDVLTNEIEQGFMQRGGWEACRYLLGKLVEGGNKRKTEECPDKRGENAIQS